MKAKMRTRFIMFLLLSLGVAAKGQISNLNLAVNPYGSYEQHGIESIDRQHLGVRLSFPIIAKNGRGGENFAYSLTFNNSFWMVSGNVYTTSWAPFGSDFGWQISGTGSPAMGYLTANLGSTTCETDGGQGGDPTEYWVPYDTDFTYYDLNGVPHSSAGYIGGCDAATGPLSADDGSGISFSDGIDNNNDQAWFVTLRNGDAITFGAPAYEPLSSGPYTNTIQDLNGNKISQNSGVYTDTTGTTVLSISGGGSAASPTVYTYPTWSRLASPQSGTASIVVSYKTYTVQTNFNCPGISEYGPESIDLVDKITYPDGTYYSFQYEGSGGTVTGRLASYRLPTGGTVSYNYTNGCGHSGIDATGNVPTLSRFTDDALQPTTFTQLPPSPGNPYPSPTTTETDVLGNQSLYTFSSVGLSKVQQYAGTATGTPLLETDVCLNTSTTGGSAAGTCPTGSAGNQDIRTFANGIAVSRVVMIGLPGAPTEIDQYDSDGTTLLQKTQTIYRAGESNYGIGGPTPGTKVFDGSNTLIAETDLAYDETTPITTGGLPQHNSVTAARQNLTSSVLWTDTIGRITTHYSYDDTGSVQSATGPTGTSTYTYDSTKTFATSVSLPPTSSGVTLGSNSYVDVPTGLVYTAFDANNQPTLYDYDSLWRVRTVGSPDGGTTTYTYAANQIGITQPLDGSTTSDTETFLDGYGRAWRVAAAKGDGTWYLQDSCYGSNGLLSFQSNAYEGNSSTGANCYAPGAVNNGVHYTYDAVGRMTRADMYKNSAVIASSAIYSYYGRAFQISGTGIGTRVIQSDGMGRQKAVCEVTAASTSWFQAGTTSTPCGLDITGSGFVTTFSYSGNTTTISQGEQTRVFTTDMAGRPLATTEPEAGGGTYGTTRYAYSYNAQGLQVQRTRGAPNATSPTPGVTTYQYDSVGRLSSVAYGSGFTPTKTFTYDEAQDWQGNAISNHFGQLTTASAGVGTSLSTSEQFSYDPVGRVSRTLQCLPGNCGNPTYDLTRIVAYNWASLPTSIQQIPGSNGTGSTTTLYGYDAAGDWNYIASDIGNPNCQRPLIWLDQVGISERTGTYANGLILDETFDAAGYLSTRSVGVPGSTPLYSLSGLAWNGNQLTGSVDSINGTWSYQYDDIGSLTQAVKVGDSARNYVHDRYGNLDHQVYGSSSVDTVASTTSNQLSLSYDIAGNMLNDGAGSTYTYDDEGRIIAVSGTNTASYVYDALDQRVQVTQNGTSRNIAYNPFGLRDQIWSSTTPLSTQVYSPAGDHIAYFDTVIHYQHQDWLGTERLRTNSAGGNAGGVDSQFTSLPYGDGYSSTGSDGDSYHYAGLDADAASNQNAVYRELSSLKGRWMSPDPYMGSYDLSNPQSFNRYSYASNDPVGLVDPSGLLSPPSCAGYSTSNTGYSIWDYVADLLSCNEGGGGGSNPFGFGGIGGMFGGPGMTFSGGGVGGGGGSVHAPSNCPAGPANVYNFIHTNQAAANALSQQSGVNADYLLGLSGWESQWGGNRFALQGNNFFSLHGGSSAPFANGSMKAGGANVYLSTFPSYFASGQSFLAQYGNGLAGATSPAAFAQQLINNHFNSGNAATGGNSNFLSNTVTGINMVIRRKGC